MEGSRHEKAALAAVAYIVGFTAAYILFGNFTSTSTPAFMIPTGGSAAAVVTATEASEVVEAEVVAAKVAPDFLVSYEAGKLEVIQGESIKLLSFNPETSELTGTEDATQGTHFGEVPYVVSNDQKFVFFCEQYDTEDTTCAGYVYDVTADKIFPVTKSGVAAKISLSSAEDAIFTAVGLKIGSNYSANPSAPWVMISESEALDLQ